MNRATVKEKAKLVKLHGYLQDFVLQQHDFYMSGDEDSKWTWNLRDLVHDTAGICYVIFYTNGTMKIAMMSTPTSMHQPQQEFPSQTTKKHERYDRMTVLTANTTTLNRDNPMPPLPDTSNSSNSSNSLRKMNNSKLKDSSQRTNSYDAAFAFPSKEPSPRTSRQ
jgi:hypothetical protein